MISELNLVFMIYLLGKKPSTKENCLADLNSWNVRMVNFVQDTDDFQDTQLGQNHLKARLNSLNYTIYIPMTYVDFCYKTNI